MSDLPISRLSSIATLENDDLFVVSEKNDDNKFTSKNLTYQALVSQLMDDLNTVVLRTWN